MTTETYAYMATCPECRGLRAACVDTPVKTDTAKAVAGYLRRGLTVDRVPVETARATPVCKCKKEHAK